MVQIRFYHHALTLATPKGNEKDKNPYVAQESEGFLGRSAS
jgi:hypothetical protein